MRPGRAPRRHLRPVLVGLAALGVASAAVAATAWEASPAGDRLGAHVAATDARPVPLGAVSPLVVRALVATEDERFYRHHGIDLIGLARAIPYDVVHASFAQGASTLTEQLAKLLYLGGDDHSPWRKLQDMAVAVKLEDRYSKSELLDAYLNAAYFGAGAHGIGAASRRYFGTSPRRLTLAQATLLAGLPQAPTAYDPLLHPAAARERQAAVLRSLVRSGAVDARRAEAVLSHPLRLVGAVLPPVRGASFAPGPTLSWPATAGGAVLVLLGGSLLAVGRRTRGRRLVALTAEVGAVAGVLLGVAVVLSSVRSL